MFHSCTVPPSLYHFVWNIATPSEIIAPPSKIIAPAFHTSIMSGTFQLSNNTDLWCTSPDFAKSKVAKVSISHQFILSISISTRSLSLLSLSLSSDQLFSLTFWPCPFSLILWSWDQCMFISQIFQSWRLCNSDEVVGILGFFAISIIQAKSGIRNRETSSCKLKI